MDRFDGWFDSSRSDIIGLIAYILPYYVMRPCHVVYIRLMRKLYNITLEYKNSNCGKSNCPSQVRQARLVVVRITSASDTTSLIISLSKCLWTTPSTHLS